MDENFNKINYDELSKNSNESHSPNIIQKIGINKVLIGMAVFFLISLIFFIYTVFVNRFTPQYDESSTGAQIRTTIKENVPELRAITGGFRFNSLEQLKFVPKRIEKYTFENEDKILSQAKKIYPDFEDADLKRHASRRIVRWAALRDFYGDTVNIDNFHLIESEKTISFSDVERELAKLEKYYTDSEIKMTGFFLKMRYVGVFEENIKELDMSKEELKVEAERMINDYIERAKALNPPSLILAEINSDPRAILMNNEETSIEFANDNFYPPFFDDPDFYNKALTLKPGEFSPIFILKTRNPHKKDLQEYAYVTFYIEQREGENMPLNARVTQFLEKNWIR